MVSGNVFLSIFTILVHNPSTLPFACQWGISFFLADALYSNPTRNAKYLQLNAPLPQVLHFGLHVGLL